MLTENEKQIGKNIFINFIFILLLTMCMLLFIPNVHASAVINLDEYTHPPAAWMFDCSSSSSCGSSSISNTTYTNITGTAVNGTKNSTYNIPVYYSNDFTMQANSYGGMIGFSSYAMAVNYLYSVEILACQTSTTNTYLNYGSGFNSKLYTANDKIEDVDYPATVYYSSYRTINPYTFGITSGYSRCRAFYLIFKPNTAGYLIGLPLTGESTISSGKLWFLGYKLETLGNRDNLTEQEVQNIINNATSDLASTSDIQLLEETITEEINEMTSEQQVTNEKLDETNKELSDLNDNITDESSPNLGSLENTAGWLPPGPLDSVLNLPLSLFNSLSTNLGKSCSPINIPLPYVNMNFSLPCINTLYSKIGISSLMSWIGVIASGFILYSYLLKLYKWIEDRISLNENNDIDDWGSV